MILQSQIGCAHLRAGGVSIALDWRDGGIPVVAYWGADLGPLSTADVVALADMGRPFVDPRHTPAVAIRPRLVLLEADGWKGRPGWAGHRKSGEAWSPRPALKEVTADSAELSVGDGAAVLGEGELAFRLEDPRIGLELDLTLQVLSSGLIRVSGRVVNTGSGDYLLEELSFALPLPPTVDELLDFAGGWTRERVPARMKLGNNIHLHESRHGRTGFDAAPFLLCGPHGFDFEQGRVFGVHVGFSGNHRSWTERTDSGVQVIGGGELLLPGEVTLAPGAEYRAPWVYFTTGDGLDSAAHSVHEWLRARPSHPGADRPVVLNVWEAVYFDHDLLRLRELADRAARIGVERFVLDDGWFAGRRADDAGLGDWVVDDSIWPEGLHPLVDHVRGLGMEFGLWVEPEMISPSSDVARAHPEWILATGDRLPVEWRRQQVLNLTIPAAYDHVLTQLDAILEEYAIAYLKWDHNRDLISAGDAARGGAAAVREQTLAAYRLMDDLRRRHPCVEIESCASGGGRMDLGMAEHAQRFWPSDCIDPLERQDIMRWSTQLLPLELLGSHVASPVSRTTGRVSTLDFRGSTALFGSFGIEWDLTVADDAQLDDLAEWVAYFRRHRQLLFDGRLHRRDLGDDGMRLRGVVARDRSCALYEIASLRRGDTSTPGRAPLPGLDWARRYRVSIAPIGGAKGVFAPPWMADPVELSGAVLAGAGVHVPQMFPEQAVLIEVEEVPVP